MPLFRRRRRKVWRGPREHQEQNRRSQPVGAASFIMSSADARSRARISATSCAPRSRRSRRGRSSIRSRPPNCRSPRTSTTSPSRTRQSTRPWCATSPAAASSPSSATPCSFAAATCVDAFVEHDKGHGRIEQRTVSVIKDVDWLDGDRRFPGEFRLPRASSIIRVQSRAELADRCRFETRYYISSAALSAETAAHAVRGHWGIENRLHWVLDVVFADDQSRLRKGHGAKNMAIIRHFPINLIRAATDKKSIKLRRKIAGWDPNYLAERLGATAR